MSTFDETDLARIEVAKALFAAWSSGAGPGGAHGASACGGAPAAVSGAAGSALFSSVPAGSVIAGHHADHGGKFNRLPR